MEELKITISCEEIVKPSSLTPNHLRFYPFSFLDHFPRPYFIPFLVFYENKTNLSNKEQAVHLKTSLSKVLSQFYPLAGRIKKNDTGVECNDEGVRFVEAKADCKMSQILEKPNSYDLNKFLSFEYDEVSDVPLKVQLTFFDCGGLVLGVGIGHRLCDAFSCYIFVKNWSAFARGNTHELIKPCFDVAKVFPPAEIGDFNVTKGSMMKNITTKRFVFSKSSIESLRERFSRNGRKEFRASRVEALSEFIWNRYIGSKGDNETGNMYAIVHPVNLRRLGDGIIPQNMFGNIISASVTIPQLEDEEERRSLVEQMREEIRKIDKEYVKKHHEGHKEVFIKQFPAYNNENIVSFVFTSICRIPVYEVDFGWGKPSWISSATICNKNLAAFMDTKEGDGIEVWISLEEKEMSRFQADKEFLIYASSNPN